MGRQKLILRTINVIVTVAFFWTNCVYAAGIGLRDKNYLGIDGKGVLTKSFPEFRVLSTPLAMHNALKAEGVSGLRELVNELGRVKDNLVGRGVVTREDADSYPAAVVFEDPNGGAKAYYYFNKDGYFIRYTEAENVNDSLCRAFLRVERERIGETIPINGGYVERFRISEGNLAGINESLKRLYGYTLDDIGTDVLSTGRRSEGQRIDDAKNMYNSLITNKESVELSIVYDYAPGKEKAFRISAPKEKDLTEEERGFVVAYLAVYIYNRLTAIGASNLRLISTDVNSVRGILNEIQTIFEHGASTYAGQYSMLAELYRMTVGGEQERGHKRMQTFYGSFRVSIEDGQYQMPPEDIYDPEKAEELKRLENVRGTYIGLDVGGSNMKVAVVRDGKLIYSKKYVWEPKNLRPASRHIEPVKAMIKLAVLAAIANAKGIDITSELARVSDDEADLAAITKTIREITKKLGRVDYKEYVEGIGISWPDIVRENKVVGGLTGKVKHLNRANFKKMITPLAEKIEGEFGIGTHLINDGHVGAFVSGLKLGEGNVVGIALGTSTGVGYLSRNGDVIDYLTDMSHIIMYFNEQDPETVHETTGIKGTMQRYLSQKGVIRLAKEKGMVLSGTEKKQFEKVFKLYEQGDRIAEEVINNMAEYMADGVQELREGYFSETPIRTFVLSGRVTEGKSGERIVSKAEEILAGRHIDVDIKIADDLDPTWDSNMRDLAQAVGAAYFAARKNSIIEKDKVIRHATALGYILQDESIDLIPELPNYPKLPRIKQPIFRGQVSQRIRDIILNNPELADVVFGLKKASVTELRLTGQEFNDLNYALLLMKHMTGASIKIFKLAQGDRHCVYDENYCRAIADTNEMNLAGTRLGLEYLIKRDIVRRQGKYYQLTQAVIPESLQKMRQEISVSIIEQGRRQIPLVKLGITELYFPTYERPDALDRALTAQTRNIELFGHKEDITLIVVDSSEDKVKKDISGRDINFCRRNMEIVDKFKRKGFKIRYIGSAELEEWKERLYRTLLYRYTKQYRNGTLDPRIREALFTEDGRIKPSESPTDPDLLHEIVFASLSIKNIAGKRTVIQAMSQGKKIASVDDDALPIVRIPTRENMDRISQRRTQNIRQRLQELYRELSTLPGIAVNNDIDFENLLAELPNKPEAIRSQAEDILNKYYAYLPDGLNGLIPIAGEQVVHSDIEHRLRFDRILHQYLPEHLIASEDTGTLSYTELPEIDDLTYYDWVPVDYLQVFDHTLGAHVGSPAVGRVFNRDLRGIAGDIGTERPDRRVLLATSHFSGDRDNSAEGLFVEALDKWERDHSVTTNYLQQVVRKAVFVEVDGSVSNQLNNGNQFCFNTTSLDNTEFPIPTTGAWLRIEEPFQFSLIRLVMQGAMAWSRTVGGHERCPGSRRPKVEMQLLWEECAMVLYRELDTIAKAVMEELRDIKDPAERIRRLGQRYMERAANYTIPPEEQQNLRDTYTRIAHEVNRLYAFYEAATNREDKEELLSLFGGFTEQFSFGVYEFEVQRDGYTAKYTKSVPVWYHRWEPARLVENYEWQEVDTGEVDLGDIDWQNNPVITMPDGTRVELIPYNRVPRQIPNAGYRFRAVVADPERQADLIQKAQEVVQKQFIWDGQQLLLWADILKVSKGYYERHELLKEKEEFHRRRAAGTLTVDYVKGLAVKAANVFMDYYNRTGEALIEAVEIIGEIAVLPDPILAKASSKGLFGGIVEKLSDSFSRNGRSANYRFYPVLIQMARLVNPALDEYLNRYNIPRGEEGLRRLSDRIERFRQTRQFRGNPNNIRKVFVLSRVTAGADVELATISIKRLHQKFPDAEVVFLGRDYESREILGGTGYVRIHPVEYRRADPVVSDLNNWVDTVRVIEEETQGMEPGSFVIVDPDSRVTRLGLLPLIADPDSEMDYSFFYESTITEDGQSTSISEGLNSWLNNTFGFTGMEYPEMRFTDTQTAFADNVFNVFNLDNAFVTFANFSVGSNYDKSMAPASISEWEELHRRGEDTYEEKLLMELVTRGARVIVDKGAGDEEERRGNLIIQWLRDKGINVVEVNDVTDLNALTPEQRNAQVIICKTTIGKRGALIKKSQCFIGYDSLANHMAASAGTPLILLFKGFPNDIFIKRWTPLSRNAVHLVKIDEKRAKNHKDVLKETIGYFEKVLQEHIDTLEDVANRRQNIDRIKALLDPTQPYRGYDVIIIASSTREEAELQKDILEEIFRVCGREVLILSVIGEESLGNFQTVLSAYKQARLTAQGMGVDLDGLISRGKKVCIVPNSGKGQRFNPLTASYNNSRGGQRICGEFTLPNGRRVPITLLTLTILSNCINAVSNNGKQVDIYWSSQIIVGDEPSNSVTVDANGEYLISTYGMQLIPSVHITEKDLNDYGTWEANDNDEAIAYHRQKTFRTRDEWLRWYEGRLQSGRKIYRDMGSCRIRADFLLYLLNKFDDQLTAGSPVLDLSPNIIQPLMLIISALLNEDISTLNTVEDVERRLDALGRLEALRQIPEYRRIIEVFIEYKRLAVDLRHWMRLINLGENPYWWAYRRPIDKLNKGLAMIADLAGRGIHIDNNAVPQELALTLEARIEAEDTRRIRGISNPVENVEINGRRYSFSPEEVRNGIEINGVYIKGSIVRNCTLLPGSRIINSIVEDVKGMVIATASELVDVTIPSIEVEAGIVHNLVSSAPVVVNGKAVVGVYRPGIRDARYPEDMTVLEFPLNLDAKDYDTMVVPPNTYSFEQLREGFLCDVRRNDGIKDEIRARVTFKKLPGTKPVTYAQNEYILGLVNEARNSGRTEVINVPDETKTLLRERAPPNWTAAQGIDFRWLIDNDKIRFRIDDLGDKELYPRDATDTDGILSFLKILYYEKEGRKITEEEYERLSKDEKKAYIPFTVIHLTKATYEKIRNNKYLLAQVFVHEFAEHFLEMTHSEACGYEEKYNSTQIIGISDLNRYILERAAERGDYKYLFGLIMQYDIRKDRGCIFLEAVYEAIDRLSVEYRDGSRIATGEEFTVWYRYVFEHVLKRSDTAVFEIAGMINEKKVQNAALRRIVDESGDRWALQYDGSDIVLQAARDRFRELLGQFGIDHIYIPQCLIDLPSDEFVVLDVEYGHDVLNRARDVLTRISAALQSGADEEKIRNAIGDDEIFELFRRDAVDEENRPIDLILYFRNLISDFQSENEGTQEKVIMEVAGKIYSLPVAQFLGARVVQRYNDLGKPIVVGIIASGGVGKSTTATLLERELSRIRASSFGADTELYPGGAFRYEETHTKGRVVHIFGPGIYNSPKLRRMLQHIKEGGVVRIKTETHAGKGVKTIGPNTQVIIMEGVFVGLDIEMAKEISIQITLLANERSRILRKLGRDLGVRKGYKDVAFAIRDTVDKLFHEKTDGVKMVAVKHADYIFAEELDGRRRLYIRKRTETAGMVRGSVDTNIPLELKCGVQRYEWGRKGTNNYISGLIGETPSADVPYAELWIGAHPKAPATVHVTNPWIEEVRIGLDILIRYMREKILGKDVSDGFSGELPYLFKVLSAGKPLSIQAHPSKQQAEEGFDRENGLGIPLSAGNRNYKDRNHKPELICALTDFYGLKGFRPLEDIADVLEKLSEFNTIMPEFRTRLRACGMDPDRRRDLLRDLYTRIMRMNQQDVDRILHPLIQRLRDNVPQGGYSEETPEYWVLRSDDEFCNRKHRLYKDEDGHRGHKDVGIFSIYLLNLVHLRPNEALYLPAGELHAYLDGVGLEIMANSDNVIRGGLTPKHVDVTELLRTLTFNSGPANVLRPEGSLSEKVYATPTPEFRLSVSELNKQDSYTSQTNHGPEALIVMKGEVKIGDASFRRGQTILIPAEMGQYMITAVSDTTVVYKASVGIFQSAQQQVPLPQAGPIAKKVQPDAVYKKLWESEVTVDVNGVKVGEWMRLEDAASRQDITPEQFGSMLNNMLDELTEVYGLGVAALVDRIRLVDNIRATDGMSPYGEIVREWDKNIILLDIDAFKSREILYIILDHELKESIMSVVACENEAIREITTNFMSLKLGLRLIREGRLDLAEFMQILPQLGADEQFFKALEVLQGLGDVTDEKILAVAIEHMRAMLYYADLFRQFSFSGEGEGISDAMARYEAAIMVFNEIMEAKQIVAEVKTNIRVVNTFSGNTRIMGLEGLPRRLQEMIGAMAKQIHSIDRFTGQITRSSDTKYIFADEKRINELKEVIGEGGYREVEKNLSANNYIIVTQVPQGVALSSVVRLVDPADLKGMPQMEGMLYLPTPYTRSAFYMAADIMQAEGEINRINPLVRELIFGLYPGLRDLSPVEQRLIFTRPWSSIILPMIQPVVENINYLHTAVVQIEKAA